MPNPFLPLTYVPLDPTQSIHVYLNGIEQYENVDWVLGGSTYEASIFSSDCSSTSGWTAATPVSIDSGRFRFVTSPQYAYKDLGADSGPSVRVVFVYEMPSLSGIGGGRLITFNDTSDNELIAGVLQNVTGSVSFNIGAGNILSVAGMMLTGSHTYDVSVKVDIAGHVIVKRDGVEIGSVFADTRGAFGSSIQRVRFGAHGNTTYLDDATIYKIAGTSGNGIQVLSPMDCRSGDLLEARYAHNGLIPEVPDPVTFSVGYINTGLVNFPLPANSAGDRMIVLVASYAIATPAGWTLVASHDSPGLHDHWIFTKVSTGGEATVALDSAGVVDYAVAAGVYPPCSIGNVSTVFDDSGVSPGLLTPSITAGLGRRVVAAFSGDGYSGSNTPFLDAAYTVRERQGAGVSWVCLGDRVSPGGAVGGTFYSDTIPVSHGSGWGAGYHRVTLIELV